MAEADSSGAEASAAASRRAARWSLQGMTALVTGGTRGIGHAVVEELAALGAAVHTCSRKEGELKECLEKWAGLGFHVTGSVCDLSVREQREALMREVASALDGKLNILINNVGTNIRKQTVEYSAEEYSFLMSTNLESAYHMCQLAHPLLKASGMGSIVFISSVAGVVALNSGTIYAATKGAINQLTKNLACEWAKDNIRTNSVSPWYTKTSLVEKEFGHCIQFPDLFALRYTWVDGIVQGFITAEVHMHVHVCMYAYIPQQLCILLLVGLRCFQKNQAHTSRSMPT